MEIAPGVSAQRWISLQLDAPDSTDWPVAISIFRARITQRYLKPIDRLVAAERNRPAAKRRFGFAVLALDCLLVETLGAFADGLTDTDGCSKAVFCRFLRTNRVFKDHFAAPTQAERVYNEFRCGILHQAEVKGDSRVWSVGPLVRIDGTKMVINRTAFHASLKGAFDAYLDDLSDPTNVKARQSFRFKMNFIARAPGADASPPCREARRRRSRQQHGGPEVALRS